jgi:L-ascorbate metabolism protein UlaG (beta-lactamase superfamily)
MKIQLIRNATMKITYAGRTFLADPMLSPKGAMDPFAGIARNPTVDLTMKTEEILSSVECVLITHNHPDHFDTAAIGIISKETPIFCQAGDEEKIKEAGFISVTAVETSREWNKITMIRTGGKHGSGKVLEYMGKVSGFILTAKGEPTVYWIGDSVWCVEVKEAIEKYRPDIIITHSGGAKIPGFEPILMDAAQTAGLAKYAPKASIVAIHMESLDHCTVTRESLRFEADKAGISASRLLIPKDGEILSF